MGTRRPLILQMLHDPSALEPRCRFQVNSFVFLVQLVSSICVLSLLVSLNASENSVLGLNYV
jgi:hypothetical protein